MTTAEISPSGSGYLIVIVTSIAGANGGRRYIYCDGLSVDDAVVEKLEKARREKDASDMPL